MLLLPQGCYPFLHLDDIQNIAQQCIGRGIWSPKSILQIICFPRTCLWVSLVCTTELWQGICFSLLDFCAILSQARRLSDAKVVGKTKRLTFTFERWQMLFFSIFFYKIVSKSRGESRSDDNFLPFLVMLRQNANRTFSHPPCEVTSQ